MNEKKKEEEEPAFVRMDREIGELIPYETLKEIVRKFLEENRELLEQYPKLNNSSFVAYMLFKPDSLSRMIRNIMADLKREEYEGLSIS